MFSGFVIPCVWSGRFGEVYRSGLPLTCTTGIIREKVRPGASLRQL